MKCKKDALDKLILNKSESKWYNMGKSKVVKDTIKSLDLLEEKYREEAFQKIRIIIDIKKQIKRGFVSGGKAE